MQNQYTTLETLATIVADTIHPTQYAVTTREMILHSNAGWEEIYSHLLSLAKEELVIISPGDRIQFCITDAGLERAGAAIKIKQDPSTQELQYVLA